MAVGPGGVAQIGTSIIGTGISLYAESKARQARFEAAQSFADQKRFQSEEILRRTDLNIENLMRQAEEIGAQQVAAFARSGVDISSGAGLIQAEKLNSDLIQAVIIQQEEAQFRSEQLLLEAELGLKQAEQLRKASKLKSIGTVLGGLGGVAGGFR